MSNTAKKIQIPDLDLANAPTETGIKKGEWRVVTGGFEFVEEFSQFNRWALQILEKTDQTVTATATLEQSMFSPFNDQAKIEGIDRGQIYDKFTPVLDQNDTAYELTVGDLIIGFDIFVPRFMKIKVATVAASGVLQFELRQK